MNNSRRINKEHSFKVLPEFFVRASGNDGFALVYTQIQPTRLPLGGGGHRALWAAGHTPPGTTEHMPQV